MNEQSEIVKKRLSNSKIKDWVSHFQNYPDLINLSIGEPSFAVSMAIKANIISAIADDESHYAETQGNEKLRHAISQYIQDQFDTPKYSVSDILITIGATEAVYLAMQGLFSSGDKIILPLPAYPLYVGIAEYLGLDMIFIDTKSTDFRMTVQQLKATIDAHPDVKGIIFNDPSNPSGVVYSAEEIKLFADVLSQTNITILTDEIYGALTYDHPHVSISKFLPDQTIIIGGLSKSHAMTGYRIGFIAGPHAQVKKLTQLQELMIGSVPTPLMVGSIAAFDNQIDTYQMKETYRHRRELMVDGLRSAGLEVLKPEGAFYALAKVPDDVTDEQFVTLLMEKIQVGVIPGSIFGAPGYMRLSFAAGNEEISEAMLRLRTFMRTFEKSL